jgi:hypothetical protein
LALDCLMKKVVRLPLAENAPAEKDYFPAESGGSE